MTELRDVSFDDLFGEDGAGEVSVAERAALQNLDLDGLLAAAPRAVAGALISLPTGTPLVFRSLDRHGPEDFNLTGAAAHFIFNDSTVTALELMHLEQRESAQARLTCLQQAIIQTRHLLFAFLRSHLRPDWVLVTICEANASLGLILIAARSTLRALEATLGSVRDAPD